MIREKKPGSSCSGPTRRGWHFLSVRSEPALQGSAADPRRSRGLGDIGGLCPDGCAVTRLRCSPAHRNARLLLRQTASLAIIATRLRRAAAPPLNHFLPSDPRGRPPRQSGGFGVESDSSVWSQINRPQKTSSDQTSIFTSFQILEAEI